ncbi:unnamed protein product [Orchesella dallaii]|uniref:Uncharacterized protein n=1 Tax=Orchesella dallaii TaxID=48710 RepID=A0ABP1RK89_9HEXA
MRDFATENPFVAPSKAVVEVQREFPASILQGLPKTDSLLRNIRSWRRPAGMKEPETRGEQKDVDARVEKRLAGTKPRHRKYKQIALDERLVRLVKNYGKTEMRAYLRGMAYNMLHLRKYRYNGKDGIDNVQEAENDNEEEVPTQIIATTSTPVKPPVSNGFDRTYSTAPIRKGRKRKTQTVIKINNNKRKCT